MTFRRKARLAGLAALSVGVAGFAVTVESSAYAAAPTKHISICLKSLYKPATVKARVSGFNERNVWVNTKWLQTALNGGQCGTWQNSLWKTGQYIEIHYEIVGIKKGDFSCNLKANATDPVPCTIP